MERAERENEQETLKGIAAVLLKLAVLAELLCVLPLSLRVLVLALLRPAEAVARAFAFERAGGALALPPAAVGGADGDGCAEALRLARCFRALAFVFGGLQGFSTGWRPFRGGAGRASCAQRAGNGVAGSRNEGAVRNGLPWGGRVDTS